MITMKNIFFGYRRHKPVLEDLTLNLDTGGVYGVLGVNGVGKTTFLHLVSGQLFPQSGCLEVAGSNPARRRVDFLEQVFYVPVAFELPSLRIAAYGERYAPFYPKFDRTAWADALRAFDLSDREQINALSFGQKKKVLLSFALASGCALLLFDEPTDGLDIPSKDTFRRLLAKQIDEQRLALIATHHVQDIALLLDHLLILKDNRLLLDASIADLTARFRSVMTTQATPAAIALYAERTPGGYHNLIRNTDGQEGPLDLEILFKAIYAHPELVTQPLLHHE